MSMRQAPGEVYRHMLEGRRCERERSVRKPYVSAQHLTAEFSGLSLWYESYPAQSLKVIPRQHRSSATHSRLSLGESLCSSPPTHQFPRIGGDSGLADHAQQVGRCSQHQVMHVFVLEN